ncbi:MAG TPA: hypothetical protein VFO72_06845 [Pyrinomonadaceae bacterium]|nr:hypothetical protein [Pyrinomonadaceae bacterium]
MSIFLLAVLAVVLICLALSTTAFVLVTGFILLVTLMSVYDRLRLRRLAEQRMGESICTFVRSFDRHVVDPWVIRAMYEEFHAYFDGALPIRAADRIEEDLRMDWDDVDDLLSDVALRAGRSLDRIESNPLYGQLRTVADLVLFLMHQPKCGAA